MIMHAHQTCILQVSTSMIELHEWCKQRTVYVCIYNVFSEHAWKTCFGSYLLLRTFWMTTLRTPFETKKHLFKTVPSSCLSLCRYTNSIHTISNHRKHIPNAPCMVDLPTPSIKSTIHVGKYTIPVPWMIWVP